MQKRLNYSNIKSTTDADGREQIAKVSFERLKGPLQNHLIDLTTT